MRRVVQRDFKERGKTKKKARIDFLKSWDIYYEKLKNKSLHQNSNKFTITKTTNIDQLLTKIFNLEP